MKAHINEIFSSIQGEGIYVGRRQIFLRFAGCNIRCGYCDTDFSAKDIVSVGELLKRIKYLDRKFGPHRSISFTGGEPLLHTEFLKKLLPRLKKTGFKIYLETNGTLPDALKGIIRFVDIVAMDIKLPSAAKEKPFWQAHKKFLNIAKRKEAFVKIVVTKSTGQADFK